jgi:sugar diacid utilization regulator
VNLLRAEDEGGIQELVDTLASRLQRSVALDDPHIRVIAVSRHFGDEDDVRVEAVLGRQVDDEIRRLLEDAGIGTLTAPTRVALAQPGLKPRRCFPVRVEGHLLGFLWIIEEVALTDAEVADVADVADTIGLRLFRREVTLERRRSRMEVILRGLITSDSSTRADALQETREDDLLRLNGRVAVAVIDRRVDGDEQPAENSTALLTQLADQILRTQPERSTLVWIRRSGLVLLVSGRQPAPHSIERVSGEVVADLHEVTGHRWTAGVGVVEHLRDAREAYEQASIAARAAELLHEMGDVVTWERLGVYGLLAKLAPRDLDLSSYPAALLRLAGNRGAEQLLATTETYLDAAGDVKKTASALHIHRATLYQRLSRVEQLSGLDLTNGIDRLTLHLGIKLARLAGTYDQLTRQVEPIRSDPDLAF